MVAEKAKSNKGKPWRVFRDPSWFLLEELGLGLWSGENYFKLIIPRNL